VRHTRHFERERGEDIERVSRLTYNKEDEEDLPKQNLLFSGTKGRGLVKSHYTHIARNLENLSSLVISVKR